MVCYASNVSPAYTGNVLNYRVLINTLLAGFDWETIKVLQGTYHTNNSLV